MDVFAILATCAALSGSGAAVQPDMPTQADCKAATSHYQAELQTIKLSNDDRDAIARVAYAEAANQGDSGLAGVVYTIINRLMSGKWGDSVTTVVNAPRQFEPVHSAGGWQRLPALSEMQRARVDTIINLAQAGRLPDLTNGALFFQNPKIVAQREAAGEASKGLTHFGGASPSAVIEDHTFYASIKSGHERQPANPVPIRVQAQRRPESQEWDTYGKARDREFDESQSWDVFANGDAKRRESTIFVGEEGQ